MVVDDRTAPDWWGDWGDWQDWEDDDEHTSPLGLEEIPCPYRDQRSLIQRLAASPDIQIVWRAARAPSVGPEPARGAVPEPRRYFL
jgi:hypothetical protein